MLQAILQNFNLIFWILTTILLLFVIFKYRKNYSKVFNSFILFTVTFLYTLYWIPQGFDITDEGFTLSKSWFMLHGMWEENVDKTFGSSLFQGLWLSILPNPSLILARIAYTLFTAGVAIVSFEILILSFSRKYSFIAVFILGIVSYHTGSIQIVNYQRLPILFVLISILLLIKGLKKENTLNIALSGLFLSIAIFSRISVIILIVYPLIYIILKYYNDKNWKSIISYNIYIYSGVLIGLFIAFLLLLFTNSIDDYYSVFVKTVSDSQNLNNSHSLSNIIDIYETDIWNMFTQSFYVSIILFLISIIQKSLKNILFDIFLIILFVWLAYYYTFEIKGWYKWLYLVLSIAFSSFFNYFILSQNHKKYLDIVFFSLMMFFLSFFGSNNGFYILPASGAGVFSISAFILLLKSSSFKLNNIKYNFNLPVLIIAIFFVLIVYETIDGHLYRDRTRPYITESFKSKPLIGIKSNLKRVEVIDSLYRFLNHEIKKDEDIFAVGTIPMLYFIFNKQYHTKDLWRQPKEQFIKLKKTPAYFIFPLKNPRDYNWPNTPSSALSEKDSLNFKFYLNFVNSNYYKEVYKNSMFKVYKFN